MSDPNVQELLDNFMDAMEFVDQHYGEKRGVLEHPANAYDHARIIALRRYRDKLIKEPTA